MQSSIYTKLFQAIKPYIFTLILAIIGLVCTKLLEAGMYKFLLPKLINPEEFSKGSLNLLLLVSLIASIGWGGSRFITKYFVGFSTKNLAKDLRAKILEQMLLVPISVFNKNAIGNLISKVNYDVEQISRALSDSILELLSSIVAIVFFIGVMFSCSWQLTLVALTSAPVLSIFLHFINIKIRKYSDRVQQSIGDISHLAHELIEASQVIRIFEAITTETQRITKLLNYNFKQELKIILASSVSESTMRAIIGSIIVVLIYMANKYFNISAGSLIGLCSAMVALIRPVKQLSEVNSVIAKGIAAAYSVFEMLELPIEQNITNTSIVTVHTPNVTKNILSLDQVNFSYNDQIVLENINLTIKSNNITAIVGKSGSGKSTLVTLLPRFYRVNSGSINLNGLNINDLNLIDLRKQFAMVNQHIVLLNDTVANNIAYGSMNGASRSDIIAAAEAANAMEFIDKLPNGLDTYIGNNGNLLSGGQRQRIAIARAILKQAPILIFDEATSALDPCSEQLIQQALIKLKATTTIIIIAHRMSTIENADQVVVLDSGKIVAVGTHQELSENLYYANLYNTDLVQ